MKKRLIVVLAVLATVVGLAFAVEQNWCATAKCFKCGEKAHYTIGAETKKEAIKEAKYMIEHKKGCPGNTNPLSSFVRATAALGSCPIEPSSQSSGE